VTFDSSSLSSSSSAPLKNLVGDLNHSHFCSPYVVFVAAYYYRDEDNTEWLGFLIAAPKLESSGDPGSNFSLHF